jgi:DNA-binding LytR/AlgR family response regulator
MLKKATNMNNTIITKPIHIGSWRNHQPSEIMLLLGNANYTEVFFANGHKLTVATTLKKLESRFANCQEFFRTHKSFLINLNYIKNLEYLNSDQYIEMQNDYRVSVSRRKKLAFQKILNYKTNN